MQNYEITEDIQKSVCQYLWTAGVLLQDNFQASEWWEKCVQGNGNYVEK